MIAQMALKSSDTGISWVCSAMAQSSVNETIYPRTSRGHCLSVTPQSSVVLYFGQRFRGRDLGGSWRQHSATPTGVDEGVKPQCPISSAHTPPSHPPVSLSLCPYLVTLVEGLEWAATGLPLPGGSHNPVFCSWKRSEKNQRSFEELLALPSPEMPKLG